MGSADPWQLVSVTVVATVLLAVVLMYTSVAGRLARLDRGDAIVLLFCGSKKSLASGLPMALVLFPAATVGLTMLPLMIFHQIQLVVCSVIASRLGRLQTGPETATEAQPATGAAPGEDPLVSADVDRVGGEQRKRQRLPAQHLSPQVGSRGPTRTSDGNADNTIQSSRSISPSSWPMVQPEYPAKIRTPSTSGAIWSGSASRSTITIRPATCRRPGTPLGSAPTRSTARHSAASRLTGPTDEHRLGLGSQLGPLRQHVVDGGLAGPVEHHTQRPAVVVLDDVDHAAPKRRFQKIGVGQQQGARTHPMRCGCDMVLGIFLLRHQTIIAPTAGSAGANE